MAHQWVIPILLNRARAPPGPATVCFSTARPLLFLFLLTVIVVIDVYPLVQPTHPSRPKRIRLTHQHAYTHARCYLSAGKMSEITVRIDTDTQTQYQSLMENPLMLFFLPEYIRFIFHPIPPFYFASIQLLCSLSLCLYPLAHKPAPWPSCGLDRCG